MQQQQQQRGFGSSRTVLPQAGFEEARGRGRPELHRESKERAVQRSGREGGMPGGHVALRNSACLCVCVRVRGFPPLDLGLT